ncbi:type II toxin-antitoxin system prevent-host-death family antitoxin [Lapillicoccus sp.]|uniref:type II toxin-antitoxin system Phd/YefM family antitoxin n=1 Tax=Lapillicoccus sp. TaxID=1909287 RepID=UPI0025F2556B|nr:type II toxin-antitoxin system prevent-host-death family antitoxin [Lapillicoccus sp.]
MEVSVTALRGDLAAWIQRARDGEEVVVTDRGVPVVRMVGVASATLLEDLTRRGVINPPRSATRPDPRDVDRPTPRGSVSDLVAEQRREP